MPKRGVNEWERGDFHPLEDDGEIPRGKFQEFAESSGCSLVVGLIFGVLISMLYESLHYWTNRWLVLGCVGGLTFVGSIIAAYTGEANASATSGFIFFGGVTGIVGCLSAQGVMVQWWFVHTGSIVHHVDVRRAIPHLEPHPAVLHFKETTYIDIAHAVDFHSTADYNLPSNSWPVCVAPLMFYHHVWHGNASQQEQAREQPLPVYDASGKIVATSAAARAPFMWAYGERCCGKYDSADLKAAITCAGWHSKSITTGVILKDKYKGVLAVKKTLDSLNLPLDNDPLLVMVTEDAVGVQDRRVLEGIIRIGLWFFGYLTLGIALIVLTRRCDWLRGSYIAPENR